MLTSLAYSSVGGRTSIGGGNVISGNQRVGVTVAGAGNVVKGNYIGTDPSGSVAVPNAIEGIWVAGQGNVVGGSTPADRNVISGNGLFGINVSGSGATANVVKGNYVGVDVTGQKTLGNRNGVGVSFGAQDNVIGGVEKGEGNVISGNSIGALVRDTGTTAATPFRATTSAARLQADRRCPTAPASRSWVALRTTLLAASPKERGTLSRPTLSACWWMGVETSGHTHPRKPHLLQ